MKKSSVRFVFIVIAVLAVFALPTLTSAQEDLPTGIAGVYSYEGSENGEAYTGSQTVTGTGPVYSFSYEETNEAGETLQAVIPGISQGNIVAAPLGDVENCSTATLLRQEDGNLFSVWVDTGFGENALGIEHWVPQAETAGFAGTYDVFGTYADGGMYRATADITEGENGVFNLVYHFTIDEKVDTVPYDLPAVAMALDNVMGYSSLGNGAACGVYVAEFTAEGTYNAVYIDAEGNLGTETGTRQ